VYAAEPIPKRERSRADARGEAAFHHHYRRRAVGVFAVSWYHNSRKRTSTFTFGAGGVGWMVTLGERL
jgi:hypothetical protein